MSTNRLDFYSELIQETVQMLKQRLQDIRFHSIIRCRITDEYANRAMEDGVWSHRHGCKRFRHGKWNDDFHHMNGGVFEVRMTFCGKGFKKHWHEASEDIQYHLKAHKKRWKKSWKKLQMDFNEMNEENLFASNWYRSRENSCEIRKLVHGRFSRYHSHKRSDTGRRNWQKRHKMPFWRSNTTIARPLPIQYSLNRIGWNFLHHENYFSNFYDDKSKSRGPWWWALSLSPRLYVKPASELLKYMWKRPDSLIYLKNQRNSIQSNIDILSPSMKSVEKNGNLSKYLQKNWLSRQLHTLKAFDSIKNNENSKIRQIDGFTDKVIEAFNVEILDEFTDKQVGEQGQVIQPSTNASIVEFDLRPPVTMRNAGDLTSETLISIEQDMQAFIDSLKSKMDSLKRIALLGELPMSIEDGIIKVHFPNADVDKVKSLMSDVEATDGVVCDLTDSEGYSGDSRGSTSGSDSIISSTESSTSLFDSETYGDLDDLVPSLTNGTSASCSSEEISLLRI